MKKIKKFLAEVKHELNRVTWPNKQQIMASTQVVILATVFVGFYIGIIDLGLQAGLKYFLK